MKVCEKYLIMLVGLLYRRDGPSGPWTKLAAKAARAFGRAAPLRLSGEDLASTSGQY